MSDDNFNGARNVPHRPPLLVALAAMLFVEASLLAVLAGFLVYELIIEVPTSLGSALGILVLVVAASGWLVVVGVAALQAKPWVRAAAFTWQVLQLAVA
ncbi:MAG: hypothetical protein IT190_06730, partial [Microbacteriaceae bacterium]|nr:hypothetical protein [Microbacteriaceae bacterium]